MNRTFVIFRQEIIATTSRFSFWLGTVGIPLMGFALMGLASLFNATGTPTAVENLQALVAQQADVRPIGLVDPLGLIEIPAGFDLPVQPYADEESALRAIKAGELRAYVNIPADYVASGRAIYVQDKLQISEDDPKRAFELLLNAGLLHDQQQALLLDQPLMRRHAQSILETPQADIENNSTSYFVAYLLGLVFYTVTLGTATTMLNSMGREKENRTLESLLSSVHPIEILSGKILALSALGLLQAVFWFGGSFLLARVGVSVLPAIFGQVHLPIALLGWSMVFFVLGYFFNASIMGAAGALADSTREASQISLLVVLPAVIPVMFNTIIIDAPNSMLSLVLSFIPPTAPMTIIMRMASTVIPWWQPVTAALLLLLSDYLLIRAAAGVFQAQYLLGGGKISIPIFMRTLITSRREA
ncbi:MAG: ABC transporter permease [Anaerolineales bacterium]